MTLYFLTDALARLAECSRSVPAADTLFHAGEPVKFLYVVMSGTLRLTRILPHGAELIMQRAEPGAIVAESALFVDRYCCNAIATETSLIRVVRIQAAQAALREDSRLLWEWAHHMAREVQQARARAEILSLKTVAHRIEGWRALNDGVAKAFKAAGLDVGVTVVGVVQRDGVASLVLIPGLLLLWQSLLTPADTDADHRRRAQLERELAAFSTPAQRCDLEATLDRYPDGITSEIRAILTSQAMTASNKGIPGAGRY